MLINWVFLVQRLLWASVSLSPKILTTLQPTQMGYWITAEVGGGTSDLAKTSCISRLLFFHSEKSKSQQQTIWMPVLLSLLSLWQNTWKKSTEKRKSWFWLMTSELSAHGGLVPLHLGLEQDRNIMEEGLGGGKLLASWQLWKEGESI
jgi:hypothetical protein